MLLRRANFDVTAHGFCNSFRDWAGNETHSRANSPNTRLHT